MNLIRVLTEEEVSSLVRERIPSLKVLNLRYVPEVDLAQGFPCKPEYLDVIRTSWLLDDAEDRPPHATVVRALGAALGTMLSEILEMKWCLVEDAQGEHVSMTRHLEDGMLFVPPFSYVEKREELQNAEVFADLFASLSVKLGRQSV